MKAITIQQPYAHLIALPDDDDRAKRVENRTWSTDYRGPLAIHAGKGKDYLEVADDGKHDEFYRLPIDDMAFGAVVAVAQLVGCVRLGTGIINGDVPDWAKRRWSWLAGHQHTEGPWCWVLTEVRRLPQPFYCNGKQGLWDVDIEEFAK